MRKADFLKAVRKIERHWGVELDRDKWWDVLQHDPGPMVDWNVKQTIKRNPIKAPPVSVVAVWAFRLEDLPGYIQLWWREKQWDSWPLVGDRFVCPERLQRPDRYFLRKNGPSNDWQPWRARGYLSNKAHR